MKIVKKLLIGAAIFLVLLLTAAVAIPYFYKDEIVAAVKKDLNKNFNAEIDFADVNISLLRSFPDLNFKLEQFSITGIEQFEGIRLAAADELELVLDLMSVIKSNRPIEVEKVWLNQPEVNIWILEDGTANYDIVKKSETPADSVTAQEPGSGFLVQLKQYGIENGKFSYNDKSGNIYVNGTGLNHSGSGDFTQDNFDLVTSTIIDQLTAQSGGISYLSKAKARLDATINADLPAMKFTLADNDLRINALQLLAEGFVQMAEEDIKMDLTFRSPENSFKNLLSLVPSAYTKDFDKVTADGQMAFNGFVKGTYNAEKDEIPAFQVNLKVDKGSFKYPDLPLGMRNIAAHVAVNSPSSDFDKVTVDVPNLSFKLGDNPFEVAFHLKTPVSDPDIDARAKGKIVLQELAQALPMEGVKTLNGIIDADVEARTRLSLIEKQDYESVNMSGNIQLQQFDYQSEGLPDIKIADLVMQFTPRYVKIERFDSRLGRSDLQASGTIDNILAYFSPDKTMTGNLKLRSNYFDTNEWLAEEESQATPAATGNGAAPSEKVFDRFDFAVEGAAGKVIYDIYEFTNLTAKGNLTSNVFRIDAFDTDMWDSDLRGSGQLTNVFNYVFEDGVLGGQLKVKSDFFNLNKFMEESPAEAPQAKTIANVEETAVVPVPDKMDLAIHADINKLLYTNLEIEDVVGELFIKNQTVSMKEVHANGLGGQWILEGSYNTQNLDQPLFDLKYDLEKLDFRKSFEYLNTFAALAPIAKFIEGNFNTRMSFSGKLTKDLMPDLSTLNAEGVLETINGVIKQCKPLELIGEKLNLSFFKNLKLKDTRNWFSVKEGFVELKEFDYKLEDVAMKISGRHAINQQSMDYLIKAKIPRKLLEKNAVTAAANTGINLLSQEAAKYGFNLNAGEFVNVNINLTGSITKPKIDIKLVGSDGQTTLADAAAATLKEAKDRAVDSLKSVANQKLDETKEKLTATTEKAIDSVKTVVGKEVDKALEKVKDEAAGKAGQLLKEEVTSKLKDSTNTQLDSLLKIKELEKAKDKLKDLNPFKKKKNNEGGGGG